MGHAINTDAPLSNVKHVMYLSGGPYRQSSAHNSARQVGALPVRPATDILPMAKLIVWSIHGRLTPQPDQAVRQPLPRFWTAILQQIAVHLLNSPRIYFDLGARLVCFDMRPNRLP